MIPTKEQADLIVQKNSAFKKKEHVINGFNVVQYSYNVASHSDFFNPVPGEDIDALELRGIAYVEQVNGSWAPFPFIPKFFNLNETLGSMSKDFLDDPIELIMDKRDGSAISFVTLLDGSLVAKSKFSFESDQAKKSQLFLEKGRYKEFIEAFYKEEGVQVYFEYTAPDNRVVILYPEESLVVLGARYSDGSYVSYEKLKRACGFYGIPLVDRGPDMTLSTLEFLAAGKSDTEGWVVRFKSGKQVKIKTAWYLTLHGLVTDSLDFNHIISHTLNGDIDDVLGAIPEDFVDVRNKIEEISSFVSKEINAVSWDVSCKLKENLMQDRKDFAQSLQGNDYMSIYMRFFGQIPDVSVIEESIKTLILKKTNKKLKAEKWLESKGYAA